MSYKKLITSIVGATVLTVAPATFSSAQIRVRNIGFISDLPAGSVTIGGDSADAKTRIAFEGRIVNGEGNGVPFAEITILNIKDKAVFGTTSDKNGGYALQVPPGAYMVECTRTGYGKVMRIAVLNEPTINQPDTLKAAREGIVPTAKRNNIKYRDKGYTVEVKTAASYDRLTDLLADIPGFTLADGIISVFRNPDPRIFIDGSLVEASGKALAGYLAERSADKVRSIAVDFTAPAAGTPPMGLTEVRITTREGR